MHGDTRGLSSRFHHLDKTARRVNHKYIGRYPSDISRRDGQRSASMSSSVKCKVLRLPRGGSSVQLFRFVLSGFHGVGLEF